MNVNFDRHRDAALEVALSSRHSVQQALSSMKHGIANRVQRVCPLSMKDILYGSYSGTKTLAIDENSSEYLVAYKWHSMASVQVRDLRVHISSLTSGYTIQINKTKLDLYVITPADLCKFIQSICTIISSTETEESVTIHVSDIPIDFMNRYARKSGIDCHCGDWQLSSDNGTVYTLFRGDVYANLLGLSDALMTNNTRLNVEYMGKVNTALMYRKYIVDSNLDLYVGTLLYSHPDSAAHDYSSTSKSDAIKRLTIRDQLSTVVSLSLNNASDELVSKESRLMAGKCI